MAKKNIKLPIQKEANKNISTKKETKRQKVNLKKTKNQELEKSESDQDEQQIEGQDLSDEDQQRSQDEEGSQSQDEDDSSEDEQSDEESSQQSLAPENYAVKQMSFRERRGTKMNYLMNRKKEEEEDPFWQNQGQNYFGDLENEEQDEDYEQSSSGRDQFDSDFGQTQSQAEEEKKVEEPEIDEQKLKEKRKQQELMRKIGAPAPKKATAKTIVPSKKPQSQKKPVPQVVNRYIHQVCTQEQLLGQAAQTEYINWLSLQKLISLQNQKKDFTHKQHFLEGDKIIYRDGINCEGKRATSYELVGVEVHKVAELTDMWNAENSE